MGDTVKELHDLVESDGWRALAKEIQQKSEQKRAALVAYVVSHDPVSEREIGMILGFSKGLDWVLNRPAELERQFERKLIKEVKS